MKALSSPVSTVAKALTTSIISVAMNSQLMVSEGDAGSLVISVAGALAGLMYSIGT